MSSQPAASCSLERHHSADGLAPTCLDQGPHANLGRPEPAIADYTAAIRLQPNYPEAYYDRALAYEQTGDVWGSKRLRKRH